MSDKSSPLKCLIIEMNVWVTLSEEEKYFYPDPIPIDCMERESHASRYDQVEAEKVNSEVGNEKWRRLLLREMCVAFDVSTDGREEDFFSRIGE
ncbi:hypothetical protein Tco_0668414 [Tanacetum coccineum]